jgi:hypothetical protein
MAEAWAVWKAIELCPQQPRIITDCLGILNTAKAGSAAATSGRNPNARIWNLIAQALEGDVTKFADTLIWMPAHQNTSAIGNRTRSDGKRLSCIDYRANRLVDRLAAHFIKPTVDARKGEKLVTDVKEAAVAALATLGEVTWKANHCKLQKVDEEGKEVTKVCRDSSDRPAKTKERSQKSHKAVKKTGRAREGRVG